MIQDFKDKRKNKTSQQHYNTRLPKHEKSHFIHLQCGGFTKENLPCGMPANKTGYCHIHRKAR